MFIRKPKYIYESTSLINKPAGLIADNYWNFYKEIGVFVE